tara:strand:+ start:251 stop:451 length:201 start_codon:yes stop_codon:yes gene_type:complete
MYLVKNKKISKNNNAIINWFKFNKNILDDIFNKLINIGKNNNIKMKNNININKIYYDFILFAYNFS